MAQLSERHEIRVRGKDHIIVFMADSSDARLVIRQESNGKTQNSFVAGSRAKIGEWPRWCTQTASVGWKERGRTPGGNRAGAAKESSGIRPLDA
jgi:hypothetical protein